MTRVFVGIGSNVDRERSVRGAVHDLGERYGTLVVSPVYECPAVGFKGQAFLNLVAGFDSDESIEALNISMKSIEENYGRERGADKFNDRTLDIDVLLYGDLIRHEGRIDVPRYEIRRYAFVLKPLQDLVPDGVHPELGTSYSAMWADFDASKQPLTPFDISFD